METLKRFISATENCFIEIITPQEAEYIFKFKNPNNRKFIPSTGASYKRQMENGTWFFNGESIGFDKNGNLTNGQHRMFACWKSNIPLKVVVVIGLETKAFETTDSGKTRSFKDALSATKLSSDASITSEMARKAYYFLKGAPTEHGSSSTRSNCANNSELLSFQKEHFHIFEELVEHVKIWQKQDRMKLFKRQEMSGIAASLIIQGNDKSKVLEFFNTLTSDNYTSNTTIYTLRKKFEDIVGKKLYVKPLERFNFYKFAWNNYIEGKSVKRIKSNTDYVNNWIIVK